MPIYEYRCSACGHEDEFLQKVSDAPLTECPKCKQPALVKKLSAAGFQLKGSGWYVTDFRGGGSKPSTKDSASSDTKSEGGSAASSTASDSKPADKGSSSGSSGDSGAAASGPKDTTTTASGT